MTYNANEKEAALQPKQQLGITIFVSGQIDCLYTYKSNAYVEFCLLSQEFKQQPFVSGKTALVKRSSTSLFGHRCVFSHPFVSCLRKPQQNPLGWPVLAVSAYQVTLIGKDRLIGYGYARIPTESGTFQLKIDLMKPKCGFYLFGGGQVDFTNCLQYFNATDRRGVQTVSCGEQVYVDVEVVVRK